MLVCLAWWSGGALAAQPPLQPDALGTTLGALLDSHPAAQRTTVALKVVDLESGEVLNRYEIPDVDFPNDLAIGSGGSIYISDTRPSSRRDSRIYRFKDGEFEIWLDHYDVYWSNGLYIHDGELLNELSLSGEVLQRFEQNGAGKSVFLVSRHPVGKKHIFIPVVFKGAGLYGLGTVFSGGFGGDEG